MTDLDTLLAAKRHSDARRYSTKHQLIRKMMNDRPDDFAVDSDDGKGILGITHRPTGFRFHMPKQVVHPRLEKMAGAAQWGMGAAQKVVDALGRNPRLESGLRRALSYNLVDPRNRSANTAVMSAAGVLPGAIAGAMSNDSASGKRTAVGALSGAALGAVAGRYGPRALQAGAGRILTNVVDPFIYDGGMHAEALAGIKPREALKAIWKDKPVGELDPGRHALFRDFFGLKRFKGTENTFEDLAKTPEGGKLVRHNAADAGGAAELAEVDKARRASVFSSADPNPAKHLQAGKPTLTSAGAMGNFHVKPDGKWSDTWDFALHPQEKIDSVTKLMRALVTPLGTPTTVTGKTLSQGEVLRGANVGKKFGEIHPSFVDPVVNRAIKGSGVGREELLTHIKSMMARGESAPTMATLAQKADGAPYNLLHSLAKADGVAPGDLRVMLGGAPRARDLRATKPAAKFSVGDLTSMFSKRIPGANPTEVQQALAGMTPLQHSKLQRALAAWAASGRQPGGELKALADTLGFAPHELKILLQ